MSNPMGDQFDLGNFELPGGPAPQEPVMPEAPQPAVDGDIGHGAVDESPTKGKKKKKKAKKQKKQKTPGEKGPSQWTPYTVMLGLALLAILVAICFLALELSRYGWDTSAENVGVLPAAARALYDALPTISAAA